jgi:hypothetical protein
MISPIGSGGSLHLRRRYAQRSIVTTRSIALQFIIKKDAVRRPHRWRVGVCSCGNAFFHRTTNVAGKIGPDNWPDRTTGRSDFPGYICSPMEKRVPTKTIWEAVQAGNHEPKSPSEESWFASWSRRARAKNRMRKAGNHEPKSPSEEPHAQSGEP